jgi:DNA-binding CsgD family transcriptional regulator
MREMFQSILGRDAELAELEHFIESLPAGPSALVLEGAAGIGKTTLWQAGVALARTRGHQVLTCRAAESEARLSYASLGDILDVDLPDVPAPQKRALDAALLRAEIEGAPPDQRAVSVASLGVLRGLAAFGPLVIAIDDIQWLDAPTTKVLSFVVRRLEKEPIALLVARRVGSISDPLVLARATPELNLRRLSIGPLSEEAMTRLLRDRTAGTLTHPTLLRLHRISSGNPFFALEIARALAAQGTPPRPGEPLSVPEDLQELLGARLARHSAAAMDSLLVVAAAGRPTEDLVLAAAARRERAPAAITKAEEAGIVRRADGRIDFTHPLLGSTVYGAATAAARRSVHRRLADLVADTEERARHLALATSGWDTHVAQALDEAARHARARGAPDAAAELSELARRLTPPYESADILRRTVEAAEHHFDAGDATRATALLEEAVETAPPGDDRANILFHLASISWLDMRRVQGLAEDSLEEAGEDAELLTSIHEHLAWVGIYRGDLAFASAHARSAMQFAEKITDRLVRAESTATYAMVEFLMGRPAEDLMSEAVRLQDEGRGATIEATVYTAARTCHGLHLLWAGELDAAREVLHHELTEYERRGRYVVRDELYCYLAEVECRAGNWDLAARYAQEAVEIGADSGHLRGRGEMLFPRALAAALQGDVEGARSDAEEGLRISLGNEDLLSASCNRAVLGFLELSLSQPSAAMEHLAPVLSFLRAMEPAEPGVIPCAPDAAEALVSLGRLDEAEAVTDHLERQGGARGRPWAISAAARCRGLVFAARGHLSAARSALEEALAEQRRMPQPFELGRTLLVKGEVERRAKQRRAARASLEQALGVFEALGAPLWAQKAQAELARVGGPTLSSGQLTPTELRIAHLVAEGKKNREVADALFISVKTVEANLSRIFHKLGVRSRTELAHRLTASSAG